MKADSIKKIVVLLSVNRIESLNESRRTRGEPVRKDSPHFSGDLYHAHKELSGGYELSWDELGKRRHPGKFPADNKIPQAAKKEIASVLGIDPNILEAYQGYDEIEDEEVFIVQEKSLAKRILEGLDK